MSYKRLYLALAVILILGALSSLAVHIFLFQFDGFFINLATELIGLLIGLGLIDFIFRRHGEKQWEEVSGLVKDQVANILRIASLYLERLLGVEVTDALDYYQQNPEAVRDDLDDPKYTLHMLSTVIPGKLPERLKAYGPDQWRETGVITVTALEQVEKIFSMFGNRLDSKVFASLIEVQRTGYRLAAFAEIVVNQHLEPSMENSQIPIKQFIDALVDLGNKLELESD